LYSGELRVLTDDPSAGTIVIPVDLWVVSGATGVELGPSAVLTGLVGTAVTHTLTLTNSGTVTDVFDLAPTGNTWPTALPDDTGYLVPGEVLTFDVVVTIPVDAADGNSDMVDITAISRLDDSVTDSATLTTRARYRRIYLPFVAK
jgi:hypothetical protein